MQNVKANLISTQLAVIFKRGIGGVLLRLLVTKGFNLQVSFTCTVFDAARGFNCSEFNVFMCNVFCYFNFVLLLTHVTVFLHLTRPGIYICVQYVHYTIWCFVFVLFLCYIHMCCHILIKNWLVLTITEYKYTSEVRSRLRTV